MDFYSAIKRKKKKYLEFLPFQKRWMLSAALGLKSKFLRPVFIADLAPTLCAHSSLPFVTLTAPHLQLLPSPGRGRHCRMLGSFPAGKEPTNEPWVAQWKKMWSKCRLRSQERGWR